MCEAENFTKISCQAPFPKKPLTRFSKQVPGVHGKKGLQGRKTYTPPLWRPPFFSFSGSEAPWCIPFFLDLWCIPCSLVFPGKGYNTIAFFALRPWGRVTDREERGSTGYAIDVRIDNAGSTLKFRIGFSP